MCQMLGEGKDRMTVQRKRHNTVGKIKVGTETAQETLLAAA